MSFDADMVSVNETRPKKYDSRYICQADVSDYSVELVVQCESGENQGVLTVWDKEDLIINNRTIEVVIDEDSVEDVADFFDQFLMGRVNQYLKEY